MSMPTQTFATAQAAVRTLQVIHGSLLMGALAFAVVAMAIRPSNAAAGDPWAANTVLTLLAIAGAPLLAITSFVLPPMIASSQRAKLDRRNADERVPGWEGWDPSAVRFWPIIQGEHIIRIALLEGAVLFCLQAFMIERKLPALVAAGVLFAVLVWLVPTEGRIRQRVETMRNL